MVVSEAITLAKEVVDPLQEIGEKWGVKFERGKSLLPAGVQKDLQTIRGRWLDRAFQGHTTCGGQGFPHMMRIVVQ